MEEMEEWISDIQFEKVGPVSRLFKACLVNPLANYMPAGLLRWLLKITKSRLAEANWSDPGGWQSMVISYDGQPTQWADKVLVGSGSIPTALRNRRVLAAMIIARLIEQSPSKPAEVLCVGAGPGQIIMDAMAQAKADSRATLVDLSSAAHAYAQASAAKRGLDRRMRFITGDVKNIRELVGAYYKPDVVKMIGICEYLNDEHLIRVAKALASVMPTQSPVVFNSLSESHGTDRFFRRVFGLHMIHRSEDHLQEIMSSAGFGQFVSWLEPLGVYKVIVARRR